MTCHEITRAETWDAVETAFAGAPVLEFDQAWLREREPGFRDGVVRLGWRADRFCYFANLTDDFPATHARARNELLWNLGDVLELFAGVKDQPAYIEYHTAPNGQVLQLLWPDAAALGTLTGMDDLGRFMVIDDRAVTRVRIVEGGWQVYGEAPEASVLGRKPQQTTLEGKVWDVSFGRYDYPADDGPPFLSSTSPLTQPAYHRRQEWRKVRFVQ